MWVPKTTEELEHAVLTETLNETSTFDAKADLPAKSKNIDIAIDVAAMSTDGGVIIYGIKEDENERPTILNPILLEGARERIANVVNSSISEPPQFSSFPLETTSDRSKGYLVVIVPTSPRAPHMVIVKGDHRYYGRTDTGNRMLSEGEVARLYQRRQEWSVDIIAEMRQIIADAPCAPRQDLGYLHMLARPVAWPGDIRDRTDMKSAEILAEISNLTRGAQSGDLRFSRKLFNGIRFSSLDNSTSIQSAECKNLVQTTIGYDGVCQFFSGRIAELIRQDSNEKFFFFPDNVASFVSRFLHILSSFYDHYHYFGHVDLCLALTGIRTTRPYVHRVRTIFAHSLPLERDEYLVPLRITAMSLYEDQMAVARKIIAPIMEEALPFDYDPWSSGRYDDWS